MNIGHSPEVKRPSPVLVRRDYSVLLSLCRSGRPSSSLVSSGVLNSSTVSKPSSPLALLPIGTLCHAENCSIRPQEPQAEEKPQVGLVACSFLAAANTSGQVFGGVAISAFFSASRLTHITMLDELKGNDSMSPLE